MPFLQKEFYSKNGAADHDRMHSLKVEDLGDAEFPKLAAKARALLRSDTILEGEGGGPPGRGDQIFGLWFHIISQPL